MHRLGIQNVQCVLAQCFHHRLQVVTKFISICHEFLYVVAISVYVPVLVLHCFIVQWYKVNISEYCASE